MKQYTIIGGINGVGKSSLSGVLRHQLPDMGLIIDPNVIVSKESCDRLTAGKLALARVENCLQKGINFSQETTLSGRRTIRTIQQAREKNYHIRLYYVGVSGAEESFFGLQTVFARAGIIFRNRTCCGAMKSVLRTWRRYCRTATKCIFTTTKTDFEKWHSIRAARSCLL